MVNLTKHTIKGQKGKTVCYTLENLRFDTIDEKLKWDDSKFYTPIGTETDTGDFNFFSVPAGEISITRDSILDKEALLVISIEVGVEYIEVLEGIDGPDLAVSGLNGDIVATGFIPAGTGDIVFDYKEVTGD